MSASDRKRVEMLNGCLRKVKNRIYDAVEESDQGLVDVGQLKDRDQAAIGDIVIDNDVNALLNGLDRLSKAGDRNKQQWRPTGDPEADIVDYIGNENEKVLAKQAKVRQQLHAEKNAVKDELEQALQSLEQKQELFENMCIIKFV